MRDSLLSAVIELLDTGDDTGCDGLVCVDLAKFIKVQKIVRVRTGLWYGNIAAEVEE